MRYKIQYGIGDDRTYIRNSLVEAVKLCERLARQGFTVALTNADTGFYIQGWN